MIQCDQDNMRAQAQVSAKSRSLVANVCRGNFNCGQALDGEYDDYQVQYVMTSEDETALLQHIAELESKISGA